MNKRSAAAALIERSLRPAGYVRETFAGKTPHHLTPERIQALRDFVAESARALDVPGVGIALIDEGKVVYQGGYGVRELGHPEPVDAHTKFMIASNTKGMSTLLSILPTEASCVGTRRSPIYPSFRLGSDATTKSTLVRHLVCACTGMPRRDYAFILADSGAPATDTFPPTSRPSSISTFGELYQYSNLMAGAAGYLAPAGLSEARAGAAYDKAMQTRIFGPLGMRDTTFDFKARRAALGAAARGRRRRPGGRDVEFLQSLDRALGLAGGAWSSPPTPMAQAQQARTVERGAPRHRQAGR